MADVLVDGDIVLYGTVGVPDFFFFEEGFTAMDVIRALAQLGRSADVRVRLNSGGGFVDEGVAIFNAFAAHKGKVTIINEAMAASAASIIFMAGDERIMRRGALMMIHDPEVFTIGDAAEHERSLSYLEKTADSMAEIYSDATGKPAEELREAMRGELWLKADEAVEQGFATGLDEEASPEPTAFNYRTYAHAPERVVALSDARGWSNRKPRAAGAAHSKETPMTTPTQGAGGAPAPAAGTAAGGTPAAGAAAPAAGGAPAGGTGAEVVNLDTARSEGEARALAYVTEVNDLCALAGFPEKAAAFIAEKKPVAAVRQALIEAKAGTAGAHTDSHQPAPGTTASGGAKASLADRMRATHGVKAS
jgi:ATP-dependent protease ClpP protease subunit